MIRRITLFGEPVLREPGQPVTVFDSALRRLAEDMVETMYEAEGIGLAAPQVGVSLRFCVIDLQLGRQAPTFSFTYDGKSPPLELLMPLALANPLISAEPSRPVPYEEGCLSFPDVRGQVVRPERITVKFQDLSGHAHVLTTGGLLARVIQHEVDHLDGVLFIDRMDDDTRKGLDSKIRRVQKDGRQAASGGRAKE